MIYRTLIASAALAMAASASAQMTDNSTNAAVKDSTAHTTTAPAKGHNSFTESQARKRLAKSGYVVTSLTKDANGVWTGSATKGGKTMTVGLDYKGNITAQ